MARDISIDVLRGLNILEMETIESCDHPIFDHALYDEKKLKYADTIFPCFSFITGMTSFKRIVPFSRDIQLIGLGLGFNTMHTAVHGGKLRIPGVLQRHGLASIILNLSPWKHSIYTPVTLIALWAALSYGFAKDSRDPFKAPEDTTQQQIDNVIFRDRIYTKSFDPEGILGALTTAVTIWSGGWFASQTFTISQSMALGGSLIIAGKALSLLLPRHLPVSKPLWTPTFVLMSSGWSILKSSLVRLALPTLPHVLLDALSSIGKRSLETYFTGELLILLLNHGEDSSIWSKAQSKLSTWTNVNVSKFLRSGLFDLGLAAFATILVNKGWRLPLF